MSTKYLKVRDLEINSELVMAMKPCMSRSEVEIFLPPGTTVSFSWHELTDRGDYRIGIYLPC